MDYINYVKQQPIAGMSGFGGGSTSLAFRSAGGGVDNNFYGDRAVWGGGYANTNEISYVQIPTTGNSSTFGTMVQETRARGPATNANRGLYMGGRQGTEDGAVEYITIGTPGNGTDFGDLSTTASHGYGAGSEGGTDTVRAVAAGGNGVSATDDMEYFTIDTTGNGTDLANLACGRAGCSACTNGTRMVVGGSEANDCGGSSLQMDYKNVMDTSNCSDFGDIEYDRGYIGSTQSAAGRGIFGAGEGDSRMDYITIATTSNASDFGDSPNMTQYAWGWTANETRGVIGGSNSDGDVIEYITIASTGNTTDFGDFGTSVSFRTGVSGG